MTTTAQPTITPPGFTPLAASTKEWIRQSVLEAAMKPPAMPMLLAFLPSGQPLGLAAFVGERPDNLATDQYLTISAPMPPRGGACRSMSDQIDEQLDHWFANADGRCWHINQPWPAEPVPAGPPPAPLPQVSAMAARGPDEGRRLGAEVQRRLLEEHARNYRSTHEVFSRPVTDPHGRVGYVSARHSPRIVLAYSPSTGQSAGALLDAQIADRRHQFVLVDSDHQLTAEELELVRVGRDGSVHWAPSSSHPS